MRRMGKPPELQRQARGSAYSNAVDVLHERSMWVDGEPMWERPRLPEDLGDLEDGALMELFTAFTEWTNYVAAQVTKAAIDEDDSEADLEIAEAEFMVTNTERGAAGIQRVTRERKANKEINILNARVLEKKALRKLTETLFNNLERSSFLVSRELSRRIGFAPVNARKP